MRLFLFSVYAAILMLPCIRSRAQDPQGDGQRLRKILLDNHFQPRVLDSAFSKDVFDGVMNLLDPDRLYFTQEDMHTLKFYRLALGEEWNSGKRDFQEKLVSAFRKSLGKAERLALEASRQPIDWQASELLARGKDIPFVRNDAALRERWKRWIKYKTLEEMVGTVVQDSTHAKITKADVRKMELAQGRHIIDTELRVIRQFAFGDLESKINTVYLRAIANAFDPHSLYLSPVESEEFMGALTSQAFSFGLELREKDNGDIIIERLVPGGPAWKSGELHKSDLLVSVKPEGSAVVSLEGIGIDSLTDLLETGNHIAIELTVRQTDGARKMVFLRKEKMEDESNIVKGFVLGEKNKIGYLSLPGFYADWGSDAGSSCANDMARQILKMKKENVKGLIVDVRSNGGGSVSEAIELAGIFIDEGPLALFKDRKGSITTLKDVNRGTIYDGPLVVLIDGRSASASEMLAAALQDYHRAIIAGTPSFGKATSQRIFSLAPAAENLALDPSRKPENGFATVTIEKIYRVTGKSVQGNGVQPDVVLPTLYDQLLPHERQLKGALPADSVAPKLSFHAKPPLPITALQAKSRDRVSHNLWFSYISKTSQTLTEAIGNATESITLSWEGFLNSPLVSLAGEPAHSGASRWVAPPEFDQDRLSKSPYEKETNDRWIRKLKNDEYVNEACHLIDDYLSLKK